MDHRFPIVLLALAGWNCRPTPPSSESFAPASSAIGIRSGAFTPSGDTLYLTLRTAEGHLSAIAWTVRRQAGWAAPEIAPFSGRFNDFDPAITADGRTLVFASLRPIEPGSDRQQETADLWIVRRTGASGWSEPERLPAPINTDGHETAPAFGPDGSLYFASSRPGGAGALDLYVAPAAGAGYGTPAPIGGVNSPAIETAPAVSPDGRWLIFTGMHRPDELVAPGVPYPRGDLYLSERGPSGWGPPRHLDRPINSVAVDCCAGWSRDGRSVWFTSERNFVTEGDGSRVLDSRALETGLQSPASGLGRIYTIPAAAVTASSPAVVPEPVSISVPAARASPASASCTAPAGSNAAGSPAELVGPGVISTRFNEFGGTPTPDGDTLYFARSVPRSYAYVLLRSVRGSAGWGPPERAPFSGRYRDFDAIFSPGGERMYFISDRPIGGVRQRGYQPWVIDRSGANPEPKPLGAPFDRFGFVWFLSETKDGEVFFNVQPPNGPARIYRVHRTSSGYDDPELLPPEVNLPGLAVREPFVAPDGSFLVFDAGGADVASLDLYVSFRTRDGRWEPARRLGAIASDARDYSPRVTGDGRWLYFTSERNEFGSERPRRLTTEEIERAASGCFNGLGNIYRIPVARLRALADSS